MPTAAKRSALNILPVSSDKNIPKNTPHTTAAPVMVTETNAMISLAKAGVLMPAKPHDMPIPSASILNAADSGKISIQVKHSHLNILYYFHSMPNRSIVLTYAYF